MPTRHPRIPNVNVALFVQSPLQARSLVHVASEPRPIPAPALNLPTRFSTPKFTPSDIARAHPSPRTTTATMQTDILAVDPEKLGKTTFTPSPSDLIDEWDIEYAAGPDYQRLQRAAHELLHTDTPVAFPTETVYGLGADATRSSAVKAIFAAKGRPADNPLIVHVHSLPQLRALLTGQKDGGDDDDHHQDTPDPIPAIYKPLIERFWPGPLTLILPVPATSTLAPEVTAGLTTFGARMPRSLLALSLLRLCDRPLAAPSANASTRPSPTAAEHVHDDLAGRIATILDGGPCEVGVESTVVDGLSSPPSILRPGGVTVEQLRACPGWERVGVAYKDAQEGGTAKPRAPGMKYRHYSPKAEVVLFEVGAGRPGVDEVMAVGGDVGVIRTTAWAPALGLSDVDADVDVDVDAPVSTPTPASTTATPTSTSTSNLLRSVTQHQIPHATAYPLPSPSSAHTIWEISLGRSTAGVARGLFSALRELDKKGVRVIYVEGIDDAGGDDIAAAVMNRLRKAAEVRSGSAGSGV
jgi:L-threonylcarbamoyladenylate synthase